MKIVIQCAGSKRGDAGSLTTADGRPVRFVAHPTKAPLDERVHYAHPDEFVDGKTWRDLLEEYNANNSERNPSNLYRASDLYKNSSYRGLVDAFGKSNIFIHSAGWGLVCSDYLVPSYDITFSPQAAQFARRLAQDFFEDFRMQFDTDTETILFLGGKHYQKPFAELTAGHKGRRIIFYNSTQEPKIANVEFVRFETKARTNWQYEAANALIRREIALPI